MKNEEKLSRKNFLHIFLNHFYDFFLYYYFYFISVVTSRCYVSVIDEKRHVRLNKLNFRWFLIALIYFGYEKKKMKNFSALFLRGISRCQWNTTLNFIVIYCFIISLVYKRNKSLPVISFYGLFHIRSLKLIRYQCDYWCGNFYFFYTSFTWFFFIRLWWKICIFIFILMSNGFRRNAVFFHFWSRWIFCPFWPARKYVNLIYIIRIQKQSIN